MKFILSFTILIIFLACFSHAQKQTKFNKKYSEYNSTIDNKSLYEFLDIKLNSNKVSKFEKIYTVKYLSDLLSLEDDLIILNVKPLKESKVRIIFLILNILYSDQEVKDYTENLTLQDEYSFTITKIKYLVCQHIINIDYFKESFDEINFKLFTREYIYNVVEHFCKIL